MYTNGVVVMNWKQKSILPGFGLSFGLTLMYMSLLVFIPLATVFISSAAMGWELFLKVVSDERVVASYKLSFGTSLLAASINVVIGLLIAWVLVRYSFPGKRFIDGIIDLPFALPTAVAGVALTTLYAPNGWVGHFLSFKVAFTPLGIVIALTFIGLPFIIRIVQPVLQNSNLEIEEAATSLGATRFQIFRKIILPELFPALLAGFSLAFARALGEYGSVIFIAGNMPLKTEIAPLLIMTKLEQYDYAGATAIAAVMLVVSFIILFLIHVFQWKCQKKYI